MASFADGLAGLGRGLAGATPEGMVSQNFTGIAFGTAPMALGAIIILLAFFMAFFVSTGKSMALGAIGAGFIAYGMWMGSKSGKTA